MPGNATGRMRKSLACFAAALLLTCQHSYASSAGGSVGATLTLGAGCTILATSSLVFVPTGPMAGVLSQSVGAIGAITVVCTNATSYSIGLDPGNGAGATVASRKMTGTGGSEISYQLSYTPGMTRTWGQTVGTDTVPGTGTGSPATYLIFGRVPAQSIPAPGSYADTVGITVTF